MQNCKLAVVVPCWNCQASIRELLNSIVAQSFEDYRVFCIDDRSTDETLSVLTEYANKYPNIRCVQRDRLPKGAQTCRNMGFDLSEGAEYVIWLDSDDLIAPYCFEQRVSYMDSHQELDFGVFPAKTFTKDVSETEGIGIYGYPFFADSLEAMLSWTLPMVGWTNIYRKSSIVRFRHKWDERILSLQDSDFNIQSVLKGMKYDFAVKEGAKMDYFYRVNEKQSTISKKICTKEHYESHLYLFSKTMDSFSPEREKKYLKYMIVNSLLFANIFKNDKDCFNRFLNLPWIRKHRVLRIRYQLWQLFHFRLGGRLFLREIYKDMNMMYQAWSERIKQLFPNLKELLPLQTH